MTQPLTPPIRTLTDVFNLVECTPSMGITFLNKLMEMSFDTNTGAYDNFVKAIEQLQAQGNT